MKKILASVATLTFFAAATPAFAQAGPTATDDATASAEIVDPIAISNVDGMSFGRIAAGGGGTVTLNADGSLTSSAPNMVINGEKGNVPTFNVSGEAGLAYTRTVPGSVELKSGLNSMTATLSGGGADALDATAGTDSFDVLGVLTVGAAQAAGNYTGSFSVSVQYN